MKTAIITGASRGIGRSVSLRIAESGDYEKLIITCNKNHELLDAVKSEIEDISNISVSTVCGNISDEETIHRIRQLIDEANLNPCLLINNAGVSYTGLIQDMPLSTWHYVMDTNVTGLFLMSKLIIPYMLRNQDGRIINISSVWGNAGASCEAAYSASKGAVNAFTKALAKELAPSGISVNAIAPGMVDTDMNRIYTEEEIKDIVSEIPAGRMAHPDEIAETVLMLSHSPKYLTGQIITVDGGWQTA